jgi:hypothetical protein
VSAVASLKNAALKSLVEYLYQFILLTLSLLKDLVEYLYQFILLTLSPKNANIDVVGEPFY